MIRQEPEFWLTQRHPELATAALRALSRLLRVDVCSEKLQAIPGGLELIMDVMERCPDLAAQIFCLRGLCNALELDNPQANNPDPNPNSNPNPRTRHPAALCCE